MCVLSTTFSLINNSIVKEFSLEHSRYFERKAMRILELANYNTLQVLGSSCHRKVDKFLSSSFKYLIEPRYEIILEPNIKKLQRPQNV